MSEQRMLQETHGRAARAARDYSRAVRRRAPRRRRPLILRVMKGGQ